MTEHVGADEAQNASYGIFAGGDCKKSPPPPPPKERTGWQKQIEDVWVGKGGGKDDKRLVKLIDHLKDAAETADSGEWKHRVVAMVEEYLKLKEE